MQTKYYVKASDFDGQPKVTDFRIVYESMDIDLEEGEILTTALCISVDPFIKDHPCNIGEAIVGFQVAKVIDSNNGKYPKGAIVLQKTGWKTVCISNDELIWYRIDNIRPKVEVSYGLGPVGMPGLTAYFGFLDICKPKRGETVLVNGCGGAVGSFVGQIARIKGCKVVGCCGSFEKMKFARQVGFNEVFNYKNEKSWPAALKKLAPEGIDCFFDNVGGQLATDVINHMKDYGRISCCGSISFYGSATPAQADIVQPAMVTKQLKMEGFVIAGPRFRHRFDEGTKQMAAWIAQGRIRIRESIKEGFEKLPEAFISMLEEQNIGKTLVRLSPEECACEL